MVSEPESGVVFPYEKEAMAGDAMPDLLSSEDAWMFQCLRLLYAQKRLGVITRSDAVWEKKKLLDRYRVMQFQNSVLAENVALRKQLELPMSEYRKNPSIENADKILLTIDGARRK